MARINDIQKTYEKGTKLLEKNPDYDLTASTMCELGNMEKWDMISYSYCLGVIQGYKLAKAEIKKKGV